MCGTLAVKGDPSANFFGDVQILCAARRLAVNDLCVAQQSDLGHLLADDRVGHRPDPNDGVVGAERRVVGGDGDVAFGLDDAGVAVDPAGGVVACDGEHVTGALGLSKSIRANKTKTERDQ